MKHLTPDILLFIWGLFFYGFRNLVGKWLVLSTIRLAKRVLLKTEHDFAVYWRFRGMLK